MIEERLIELGIIIPEAPKPLASYVPAVKSNGFVFTSGQLPMVNGVLSAVGRVGYEVSLEDGVKAARTCGINCLSAIKTVIGSLDEIERVVKLTVFINSADGFTSQPEVANGASELMLEVFGEAGKHSRSAVGVSELPRNAAVEIELLVELKK